MKAVFTAAALLATLAVPAAFAGTRDNPHPMKETSGDHKMAPAKTTTKTPAKTSGKAAPAGTMTAPAAKTN